jgi:hypothetical protein
MLFQLLKKATNNNCWSVWQTLLVQCIASGVHTAETLVSVKTMYNFTELE